MLAFMLVFDKLTHASAAQEEKENDFVEHHVC